MKKGGQQLPAHLCVTCLVHTLDRNGEEGTLGSPVELHVQITEFTPHLPWSSPVGISGEVTTAALGYCTWYLGARSSLSGLELFLKASLSPDLGNLMFQNLDSALSQE